MQEKFYVTTPIYYGNGLPHIGHFYSSTIANTIYLYNKISGKNCRFTTGIDENSQKSVLKAQEKGMEVLQYLDVMAKEHQEMWDFFNFRYTDFIRTTEKRHHKVVQEVLAHCFKKGDIYEGIYEGLYCVGCEAFKKEEDLIDKPHPNPLQPGEGAKSEKVCPDHLIAPQFLKEKNYFFRLSKYQTWLEEFYEANPNFVSPDFRFNEVKAFVKRGLEDFSISRETNTFGIPLPFDEKQVTYVWFDALFNYYTSCKYSKSGDKNNTDFIDESDFWIRNPVSSPKSSSNLTFEFPLQSGEDGYNFPSPDWRGVGGEVGKILHIVGKDIIRFHAIFWPCMLASYFDLGETSPQPSPVKGEGEVSKIHFKKSDLSYLPNEILTGGFFTVDGQKMSKTIGNVINPVEYSEKYCKEMLILYMLSAFPIGNDGDYDKKDAVLTYNAKLANNFGNLLNRAIVLTLKMDLENGLDGEIDKEIKILLEKYLENFQTSITNYDLKNSLDFTFAFLDEVNNFVTQKEPWNMMKILSSDSEKDPETSSGGHNNELYDVMYTISESIRQVALNLYSFFPEKMQEVFEALNLENYVAELENGKLVELRNKKEIFYIKEKAPILFEKFELE